MKDIPRRLGSNEALDAAVGAVTKAYTSYPSRHESVEVLAAYTHALQNLRICLQDPNRAQTADTLCAIWLIVICQVSARLPNISGAGVDTADRDGFQSAASSIRPTEKQWHIF